MFTAKTIKLDLPAKFIGRITFLKSYFLILNSVLVGTASLTKMV